MGVPKSSCVDDAHAFAVVDLAGVEQRSPSAGGGRQTAGGRGLRGGAVPRRPQGPAAAARRPGGGRPAQLSRRHGAGRPDRRPDRGGAGGAVRDGVRRARRPHPRRRAVRAAAADGRLRAARVVAAADRRARGVDLGARRRVGDRVRGGAGARRRPSSRRCSRCSSARASCVARVARLGWIADYLSRPVLVGYIHGVAVVLVIGQLAKLLGLDIDGRRPAPAARRGRPRARRRAGRHRGGRRDRAGDPARRCASSRRASRPRCWSSSARSRVSGALDLAAHGVAVVGDDPLRPPASWQLPSPSLEDTLTLLPAADRHLPRVLRRRGPDGPLLRGQARPAHPRRPGAPRHGRRAGRRRADARACRSERAARGPPSTTRWAPAARSPGCSPPATVVVVLLFLTGPIADLPKAVLGAVIVVGRASGSSSRRHGGGSGRRTASSSRSPR